MPDLHSLDHIALTVRDVAASAAWYAEVLGLTRVHEDVWGDVPTMMAAGNDTMLALFPVKVAPGSDPKPPSGKDVIAMRHFAFRTDRAGFEQAQTHLRERGIEFRCEDHTIAHSIYFHDLDGHKVEITTYDLQAARSET